MDKQSPVDQDVEIRFLSGNSLPVKNCHTFAGAMVHAACAQGRFATDVMVSDPSSGKLLVNVEPCPRLKDPESWFADVLSHLDQCPPQTLSVMLKPEDQCVIQNEEMLGGVCHTEYRGPHALLLNLQLHAIHADVATCVRLSKLCKEYFDERERDRDDDSRWYPCYFSCDHEDEDNADYAENLLDAAVWWEKAFMGIGNTKLLKDTTYEDKENVCRTLLEAGVSGWVPLRRAFRHDNSEMVGKLLAAGFSVDSAANTGNTALMAAASSGNRISMVANLLSYAANVNLVNQRGESALMLACNSDYNGQTVVQLLLDAQACLDLRSKDGKPALEYATRNKKEHKEIVSLLIAEKRHREIVALLVPEKRRSVGVNPY